MWQELAQYARWAPSPHNTQPTRLRIVDDEHAELHFVQQRGLPVGDPAGKFTQVTFGIFAETLRIAAHARGFELEIAYTGEALYGDARRVRKVADLRLRDVGHTIPDLDPALILRRRTNRHPYNSRTVPDHVIEEVSEEAQRRGHSFSISRDAAAIESVRELNADSLLSDLSRRDYRHELDTWMRYTKHGDRSPDGLTAGAMVLPRWLLKGVFRSHWLVTAPVVEPATRRVYMRTMNGIATVGWVQGDFADAADWTSAGHLMMRLWLILTRHGVDWQPYGSVITNDESRRSMTEKFGMREGDGGRDMVWLLVRLGYSDHEPVRSRRLDITEVVA